MSTYQEIYKEINKKFGDVIEISLAGENERKCARLEAYYDDTINWEGQAVEEPVDWEGTKIKKVEELNLQLFFI